MSGEEERRSWLRLSPAHFPSRCQVAERLKPQQPYPRPEILTMLNTSHSRGTKGERVSIQTQGSYTF